MIGKDSNIAVIGAGAVGQYYGARLAQHGYRVNLLTKSDCAAINSRGMRIESRDGDFALSPGEIRAYANAAEMPKADLIVVTLKTTANDQFPELVGPAVKEESAILTLQNGLGNEHRLAELFGVHRVLGGMAFVCINRVGPGEIVHSDHGMIRLGEWSGGMSERARQIAEMFSRSKVPCEAIGNMLEGRWEKLVWNVPFNGLGALLDRSTDELLDSPEQLRRVRALMEEIVAIAGKLGIQFPDDLIDQKIAYTRTMGQYKTSTQIDRQKNRAMEIESIWGEALGVSGQLSVSCPELKKVYDALAKINRPGDGR